MISFQSVGNAFSNAWVSPLLSDRPLRKYDSPNELTNAADVSFLLPLFGTMSPVMGST